MTIRLIKQTSSITLLLAITNIHAGNAPERCPSVSAIKQVGLQIAIPIGDSWAAGTYNQKYDTHEDWTFIFMDIKAASNAEAFARSNAALQSLVFQAGPINSSTTWMCTYSDQQGYPAYAINHPVDFSRVKTIFAQK